MSFGATPFFVTRGASKTEFSSDSVKWPGIVLVPVLFLVWILPGVSQEREPKGRNVILIGWDGTQRAHLLELLQGGQMPNLKALIDQGCFVHTQVTTGPTQTKSGWTEILTGYNALQLGIISNRDYRPIPKGLTVFERLKVQFGSQNLATIFIGGKSYNIGNRGPHEVCENCISRDPITHRSSLYQNKDYPSRHLKKG